MEFLCDRGADVNRGLRSSSLHYAACFGRPQIVKVTFIVILTVSVMCFSNLSVIFVNEEISNSLLINFCKVTFSSTIVQGFESKIFSLVIFNGHFPDELDLTVCLLPQFQPSLC